MINEFTCNTEYNPSKYYHMLPSLHVNIKTLGLINLRRAAQD